MLSPFGSLNVEAAGSSQALAFVYQIMRLAGRCIATQLMYVQLQIFKMRHGIGFRNLLGIQMSMTSLWFGLRLCQHLYIQSMEDDC
jgi:hypothetical protein